jgi:hypothetical protein
MRERFERALLRAASARIDDVEQAVAACARLDHAARDDGGCLRRDELAEGPGPPRPGPGAAQAPAGRRARPRPRTAPTPRPRRYGRRPLRALDGAAEAAVATGPRPARSTCGQPRTTTPMGRTGRTSTPCSGTSGTARWGSSRRAAHWAKPPRARRCAVADAGGPGGHDAARPRGGGVEASESLREAGRCRGPLSGQG